MPHPAGNLLQTWGSVGALDIGGLCLRSPHAKDRQGVTYRPLVTYTFHEYILKADAHILFVRG